MFTIRVRLGDLVKNLRPLNVLHDLENFIFESVAVNFDRMDNVLVLKGLQNLKLFFVSNYLLLVVIPHNFYRERFGLNVIIIAQLSS